MARTTVGTGIVRDASINKDDIDTTISGKALITDVKAGTNISLIWTGADEGTGSVTINSTGTSSQLAYDLQKIETLMWMGL